MVTDLTPARITFLAVKSLEDVEMHEESRSFLSDSDEDEDDEGTTRDLIFYPDVPVVMPRRRFAGQCNVETVKDGTCSCSVHGHCTDAAL